MKVEVLDIKGNKKGTIDLADAVFGVEPNQTSLVQYLRIYAFNQRQGTASTKTRAEVSGGGKKPWRQKGTGRARHGSTRSPIWVHGGVAHGPKPKDWSLNSTKGLVQKALVSALSQKAAANKILVVELDAFEKPHTKTAVAFLQAISAEGRTGLVWLNKDDNLQKSLRNIPTVKTIFAKVLNAFDVVSADTLILVKDSVDYLNSKYEKGTDNADK